MDTGAFFATLCILGIPSKDALDMTPRASDELHAIANGPRGDRARYVAKAIARVRSELGQMRAH